MRRSMRNTPYPRYTIGNKNHRVFDLSNSRGLIQGITEISDLVEIRASDLVKFDFTPFGECRIFDADQKIEVVSFGGHHARGGFVSKLESQALTLEAGAKLTGPIAWRAMDDENPAISPDKSAAAMSNADAVIMAAILIGVMGSVIYLAPLVALGVVGLFILLFLAVLLDNWADKGKNRSIAKMGSIYVYAPSERTWAA